jgi:hypothetical protein
MENKLPEEVSAELRGNGYLWIDEMKQYVDGLLRVESLEKGSPEYTQLVEKLKKSRDGFYVHISLHIQGIDMYLPKTLKWTDERWKQLDLK